MIMSVAVGSHFGSRTKVSILVMQSQFFAPASIPQTHGDSIPNLAFKKIFEIVEI